MALFQDQYQKYAIYHTSINYNECISKKWCYGIEGRLLSYLSVTLIPLSPLLQMLKKLNLVVVLCHRQRHEFEVPYIHQYCI